MIYVSWFIASNVTAYHVALQYKCDLSQRQTTVQQGLYPLTSKAAAVACL